MIFLLYFRSVNDGILIVVYGISKDIQELQVAVSLGAGVIIYFVYKALCWKAISFGAQGRPESEHFNITQQGQGKHTK